MYAIGPKQRKTLTGWAVDEPAVDRRGRAGVRAGLADGARARTGPHGEADGAIVRQPRPFPARGESDVVARWPQGHRHRRCVHRRPRQDRAGRPHQGHCRHAHRRSARARRAAAAVERDVRRRWRRKRSPPGWVNAGAPLGPLVVATLDGQKVLQKTPTNTLVQARPRSSSVLSNGRTTRCRPTCARRRGAA